MTLSVHLLVALEHSTLGPTKQPFTADVEPCASQPSLRSLICLLSSFSLPPGMNVLESSPYEPFVRGFDYVRLASITAGRWVGNALTPPVQTGKSFVLLVSIAWLRSSSSFFQGVASDSFAELLHVLGKTACDFFLLAVSCPYSAGLGLRDVVQRPLPVTHPRHTHYP